MCFEGWSKWRWWRAVVWVAAIWSIIAGAVTGGEFSRKGENVEYRHGQFRAVVDRHYFPSPLSAYIGSKLLTVNFPGEGWQSVHETTFNDHSANHDGISDCRTVLPKSEVENPEL
jgi:hypothetical protein